MKKIAIMGAGVLVLAMGNFFLFLSPLGAFMTGAPMGHSIGRSISLGDLTLTGVYPRIFSPNGDGANDKVGFHFDNPELLPISGTIFDLTGAHVASLTGGTDPTSLMLWDGKNSDGKVVPAGIYLYQITYQGKSATGTVIVAR